ncbi:extracellular solute-binding protein [Jannaschia sp. Os4]|uniref:ABC transporter substrate-binding protein n=1 Tax=Jannaschia sp. Os4 TaxID=2807617 RepID=UPI001939B27B|nr:extracellular solute-binding protein [Jannaschia sp. Os4]MBM2576374.1 extracellular solute-binding protein [Jannaschia sp. Os4]
MSRRTIPLAIGAAMAASAASAQDAPLQVAMHYTQEQAAPLIACIEAWDGGAAEYQQISYGDYLQTVLTGRLAGQSPDIYNVYGAVWGAQMVENGVLAPVPDDLEAFVRDGYAGGTVEAATIGGTLYGVPTEVSVYMLVSNMALLRETGFDAPPATWDELREMAEAVQTTNEQGRTDTAGFAFFQSGSGAGMVHPWYALTASEGGAPYGADGEVQLSSEAGQAALERMAGLVRDGIVDPTVDAYDAFPAGGAAMMIMANWYESAIEDGLGSLDDVVVSAIPMGEDWRTLQYAFFMGVDSGSDRQDDAWALVRHLNEPRDGEPSCVAQMLDGLGALTASAADTAALPTPDAFTQPYVDALAEDRVVSQPNVMQASEIERTMARTFEEVLAGEAEVGAALEDLNGEVEDILFEFQ